MEKKRLKFVFSVDDGQKDDLKIAELLLQKKLPGIFFIPTFYNRSRNGQFGKDDIFWLYESGFEIGGHTMTHPEDLKQLSNKQMLYEIIGNKLWLESITDEMITKFAYPGGKFNNDVIDVLRVAGYQYARTTNILEGVAPYEPFRSHTTIHIYPRREYQGIEWDETAKDYAQVFSGTGSEFHIWAHSSDLDKYNYWERLEAFLDHITETYEIVAA